MIERTVFAQLMAAMSQRIGKALGDEALAMYFAILSEELTTEQFQAGMKGIFHDHGFATWPSPAEIVQRGKPAGDLRAASAWAALEDALKRRVSYMPLTAQFEACGVDDCAAAAFFAIGGLARWKSLNDFRFDEMRREFLARYADIDRLPPTERRRVIETHIIGRLAEPPRASALGASSVHSILPRLTGGSNA